jgi:hypothetical protein
MLGGLKAIEKDLATTSYPLRAGGPCSFQLNFTWVVELHAVRNPASDPSGEIRYTVPVSGT